MSFCSYFNKKQQQKPLWANGFKYTAILLELLGACCQCHLLPQGLVILGTSVGGWGGSSCLVPGNKTLGWAQIQAVIPYLAVVASPWVDLAEIVCMGSKRSAFLKPCSGREVALKSCQFLCVEMMTLEAVGLCLLWVPQPALGAEKQGPMGRQRDSRCWCLQSSWRGFGQTARW